MNSRLLTLDNLIQFYSTKKKSMSFSSDKSGEPVVVQVDGKLSFSQNDDTEGLTAVRLQACHTEKNLNKSSISFETMKNKMLPSFRNRPILGYIHSVEGTPQFADHRMHIECNDENEQELVYDEIAVGIIPETNNAELVYDEENDRYNVMVDGYLFDAYTKASEILQREQECSVSVEISIRSMSWDNKNGCLNIEDGYFSGVTILGYNEDGSKVMPGMANSNIKLKDFSQSNNSIFSELSEEENSKLIETLEKLNTTLSNISNFNIQNQSGREEIKVESNEIKVNEEVNEVIETESTEEVTTENSEETVDTPEVVEVEKCKTKKDNEVSEEFEEDSEDADESEEVEDVESEENEDSEEVEDAEVVISEDFEEDSESEEESAEDVESTEETNDEESISEDESNEESNEVIFSKTFELSHSDVKASLYALLSAYESANNDWYWITEVFDSYFVYQGMMGDYHGQKYVKNADDTVAFDGESYNLYAEFLTESERAALTEMRSNYSSIQTELNSYKDAEVFADKMTVFEDEAYSAYLETKEFKSLMSEESVKQFSKEELAEKADAALGKVVKTTKNFAMETKKEEVKKPSFFAFARQETQSSFLDGLLKK